MNDTPSKLETQLVETDISDLRLLKVNARYMTGPQLNRLAENIRRDGALTSVPLVAKDENGELEVLSGNHRVTAARMAGLQRITVMEVLTPLPDNRKIALQLSHNAVNGQDDLSVLQKLYDELDFDSKAYSGITDDWFENMAELDISGLSIGQPEYQELSFLFLPGEMQAFEAVLSEIEAKAKKMRVHVGDLDQFQQVFDAIVRTKRIANVHNASLAIEAAVGFALERIEQLEQEERERQEAEA